MQRAAVLIGVKKTGNLPELRAVTSSVQEMARWARSQELDCEFIKVVIDDERSVNVQQIKDAIQQLVDRNTIDQLIVYFAGHGFNKEGEYWLLSDSPRDPNAAVNVEGSIRLARYCGISHVVFISDSCRTAAEGLQALQVQGSLVSPNEPVSSTSKPVDVLFACARGKPSYEVSNPGEAAIEAVRTFSAVYSEVLLEYLNGEHEDILKRDKENGKEVGLLLLGELADRLKIDVPERLKAKLGGDLKTSQYPDDYICRQTADAWLARIHFVKGRRRRSRRERPVTPVSRGTLYTPFSVSNALLSHALANDLHKWDEILDSDQGNGEVAFLKQAIRAAALPFGPTHFESGCGFKVRGARVVRTVQNNLNVELLDSTSGSVIRMSGISPHGSNVLLVLENGSGVVVPALPDLIGALSFDGSQFIELSYEPSKNSRRWDEYATRSKELRSLRASVAASARLGVFRLDDQSQLTLLKRMQMGKGIELSLALYAAYAYDTLERRDLIDEMRTHMVSDVGLIFFDIGLLSGGLRGQRIVPSFPMLSQGWPLLSAYRIELPSQLQGIEQHRLPSLWTLFDKTGVAAVEAAIKMGEIP